MKGYSKNYFKEDKIQKFMLPSLKRQIVLVDTNTTRNDLAITVDNFHHPITIFSQRDDGIVHSLACRRRGRELSNYYKANRRSWTFPFDLDSLTSERLKHQDISAYKYMAVKSNFNLH